MLEDILMNARLGVVGQPVTSQFPAGRSPFPRIAEFTMGDSVTSRFEYSLPIITKFEDSHNVLVENIWQEPCSSKQADARLAQEKIGSEKPGSDSPKTLQQIKVNE